MNVANDHIFYRSLELNSASQNNRPFSLVYHGQICRRYGIDLAIQAIHLLREDIPEIRLIVHGRGDYLDELQALTEKLALGEHVQFSTHFVPTPELPRIIRSAHAGVVPYRQDIFTDEILPTKLMEYTALGIPAISARTSAIAAYFDDDMVQFFTPEDANDLARCILMLYKDRERLAQLRRKSDEFNQRYNWKKVASQYVELVGRLNQNRISEANDISPPVHFCRAAFCFSMGATPAKWGLMNVCRTSLPP